LTAEPITTDEDAWRVVFASMRRWQIELSWRFDKSALAFQSPRLWRWQERMKLLAMATLAYAFLLQRLSPRYELLRLWLLRRFCHRSGSALPFPSSLLILYKIRDDSCFQLGQTHLFVAGNQPAC